MKTILTYGTFDLLHYGHINLLRRAKELGRQLIVGLSTNEFNEAKNKKCYFSFNERKILLEAIRYVDLVIEESSWEQKMADIKKYNVDIFVMGDDWRGKFDFLSDYCEVKYLSRTPEISTTQIKKDLERKL
jgi:glycerol-3-phosphate cytidylyltransferase